MTGFFISGTFAAEVEPTEEVRLRVSMFCSPVLLCE